MERVKRKRTVTPELAELRKRRKIAQKEGREISPEVIDLLKADKRLKARAAARARREKLNPHVYRQRELKRKFHEEGGLRAIKTNPYFNRINSMRKLLSEKATPGLTSLIDLMEYAKMRRAKTRQYAQTRKDKLQKKQIDQGGWTVDNLLKIDEKLKRQRQAYAAKRIASGKKYTPRTAKLKVPAPNRTSTGSFPMTIITNNADAANVYPPYNVDIPTAYVLDPPTLPHPIPRSIRPKRQAEKPSTRETRAQRKRRLG